MLEKKRKFPVTLPYTTKGKKVITILSYLYAFVGLFLKRKWLTPKKNFEENPRTVGWLGAIYLGYKYYFAPHLQAEEGIEKYFRQQNLDFQPFNKNDVLQEITMSVGGDLMPYEWINKNATQHLWDEVGDWFFDADLVIANLETPIDTSKSQNCVPELMLSDMYFNGSEEMFDIFSGNGKYKGYDLLCTANNHSMDMGEQGLRETIAFLKSKNIPYVGTALDETEQKIPVIIERKGIKFAFIAWTANLNQLLPPEDKPFMVNYLRLNVEGIDIKPLVIQAKAARAAGADIIITMLHTGNAYQAYPSAHTVANFHRIFEQTGSDVILGYHPHNAQPMEKYTFKDPFTNEEKQGFAIYSTADFIAYDIFVWDRMIPLLKLKFQQSSHTGKTKLSEIELKPTYMWGTKFPEKGKEEIRMLDLKKLIKNLESQQIPSFLDTLSIEEAFYLNDFCNRYFLPENFKN
jgi:poly-gamma-glutamate synthesis protein (capsule biosynthesis protein)